jgi:hypothetical protein
MVSLFKFNSPMIMTPNLPIGLLLLRTPNLPTSLLLLNNVKYMHSFEINIPSHTPIIN